jgi:5-methyltetrahydropteroyltriglutamate--homocysteine methyltransferase
MPRILTTHAGSLPRPAKLAQQFVEKEAGRVVDEAAMEAEIDAAAAESVRRQVECGLDIVNDGEQGRAGFFSTVRWRMTGFGGQAQPRKFVDIFAHPDLLEIILRGTAKDSVSLVTPPQAIGAVSYVSAELVRRDAARLVKYLPDGRKGFMTAPSPGIVAAALRNDFYPSETEYLNALGAALRVEYEAIVNYGFLLQLDCPDLAMERHMSYQDRPLGDFLAFVDRVVNTINVALVNIPRDKVRLHVCWGNYEGPHDCDVELQEVMPVLRQLKVGGFVLPFANPRHAHEYRVLKDFPLDDDQIIVAGVIDSVTNFVEHPETIAERIERVAQVVGDPTRVQAGTDCGFDTSAGMGRVASDIVWAKLTALSEGARIASGRLF